MLLFKQEMHTLNRKFKKNVFIIRRRTLQIMYIYIYIYIVTILYAYKLYMYVYFIFDY